jgi:hypothetical protein
MKESIVVAILAVMIGIGIGSGIQKYAYELDRDHKQVSSKWVGTVISIPIDRIISTSDSTILIRK